MLIRNNDKVLFRNELLYFNYNKVQKFFYVYLTKNSSGKINLNIIKYIIAKQDKNYLVINKNDSLVTDKVNFLLDNGLAISSKLIKDNIYLRLAEQ